MRWIKRVLWLCLFCVMLISNVLTATSVILSNVVSGLMGTVLGRKPTPLLSGPQSNAQLREENRRLNERLEAHRTAMSRVGNGAAQRSKRLAMHNVTEMTLGALPVGGITILIAGTAWELSQLCEGMKEMDALYTQMEMNDQLDKGVMEYVCNPTLPGFGDPEPSELVD